MIAFLHRVWLEDEGQDIAEYAVMLATILIIVIGTIRLIGQHAAAGRASVLVTQIQGERKRPAALAILVKAEL